MLIYYFPNQNTALSKSVKLGQVVEVMHTTLFKNTRIRSDSDPQHWPYQVWGELACQFVHYTFRAVSIQIVYTGWVGVCSTLNLKFITCKGLLCQSFSQSFLLSVNHSFCQSIFYSVGHSVSPSVNHLFSQSILQ